MWTHFWDMHSGGGSKEQWQHIFIEAPENEAISIFYSRFGHNPYRVSCTCCGCDYSIDTAESLDQLTGYHRGCDTDKSGKYIEVKDKYNDKLVTLEEYMKDDEVKFIFASEIQDNERTTSVPEQGYVWQD